MPGANTAAVGVGGNCGWKRREGGMRVGGKGGWGDEGGKGGREGGNFTALTTPAPPPMGPKVSITQWGEK